MEVLYNLVKLKSLAPGERIAFVRRFRRMTQQELGLKCGMQGPRARNRICRYERTSRKASKERIREFAEILDCSENMLKRYDLKDPTDIFYIMLWLEELTPNDNISNIKIEFQDSKATETVSKLFAEWRSMRRKYKKNEISYENYMNWKLKVGMQEE
ncbi:MAG: helix-turn-helix transcriptional regulator [Lachnospiraceae bacterium]|nr:helix-turn-helix transcriptional regulator [Lachnospiraceae bacterium]